jgi:hypothetical protein
MPGHHACGLGARVESPGLRLLVLASASLVLAAAALITASPVAAQDPCPPLIGEAFTGCQPVLGPWVAPGNDEEWTLECPGDTLVVATDAGWKGAAWPVGFQTGGGFGPGIRGLWFEAWGTPTVKMQVRFALGCAPVGSGFIQPPTGSALGRAAGITRPYRMRVRHVRIRPGAVQRVRHGCGRGERLVHSGSGIGFFTPRPPSPRLVRGIEHRHRRRGSVTRTFVAAPPGVGDDERVVLQVLAVCSRGRRPAAGTPTGHPCLWFTDCTPVHGPWVASQDGDTSEYDVTCPMSADGKTPLAAEGTDIAYGEDNVAIWSIGVETGNGLGPGRSRILTFGIFGGAGRETTWQPWVGCLDPRTAILQPQALAAGLPSTYHRRVRHVRIRPGAVQRVRLGCAHGERLLGSGSAVGFFTPRPPSRRVVEALVHRHSRTGAVSRTVVAAPPGVGDDERVVLQVTAHCRRAR